MVKNGSNGANLGFEEKLWKAADKMRNNMDAAEYKHVVLGLIFLKYISDAFEEKRNALIEEASHLKGHSYTADKGRKDDMIDDPDEYRAENVFFVPERARWGYLQKSAKQSNIGKLIDDAMDELEKDNSSLRGVLPKNYAREGLDKQRLGELIDLIGTIGLGDRENRSKDILGRVYEYFIGQFADAEGKSGGQFYTAQCIVKLLTEMLEPFKGRVFDPCCGSGGMFVQSEKFVEAHGGKIGDISIFGQESNQTTWRLCKMNLAIRGIDAKIVWNNEGSFLNDGHKDLKADFVMANPPFNDSDWKGEMLREDIRWKYGVPPVGNANFAWIQHFIHHLSPTGIAGFVLSNKALSSDLDNEGEIRTNLIKNDLIDCIVTLPDKLFYNTPIAVSLWFVSRDKKNHKFRDRRGEVLFIDARERGIVIDRRHRELSYEDIKSISDTYHAWRGESGEYKDIAGFCKATTLNEIDKHNNLLIPGEYIEFNKSKEESKSFKDNLIDIANNLKERKEYLTDIELIINKTLEKEGFLKERVPFSVALNSHLLQFIKSLFKTWFIDFEFSNDKGKPYKSNGGGMVDSEIGKIPKGWEIKNLGALGNIQPGYAFSSKHWVEEGYKIIKITNIQNPFVDIYHGDYIDQKIFNGTDKRFYLLSGDIIIAMTGANVGKVGIVPLTNVPLLLNQRVGKVVSEHKLLYYLFLSQNRVLSNIRNIASASSAQGNISNIDIERIPISLPIDNYLVAKFTKLTTQLYNQLIYNTKRV